MEHLYDFYVGICYLQLNKMETAEYYFNKTLADEKNTNQMQLGFITCIGIIWVS